MGMTKESSTTDCEHADTFAEYDQLLSDLAALGSTTAVSSRRADPQLRLHHLARDHNPRRRVYKRRFCYDLFCGCGGVGVSLAKAGFKVECADNEIPKRELPGAIKLRIADLGHARELLRISKSIKSGSVAYVSFAVPCGSFSILRIRGNAFQVRKRDLGAMVHFLVKRWAIV